MSAPPANTDALIGPNAVLQLAGVLDTRFGTCARDRLLSRAGITSLPRGDAMIAEQIAARFHQALRRELPGPAVEISRAAGRLTGSYIIENRIPPAAGTLLRWLPARLSRVLLARAIARHAWTFAGSGTFHVVHPDPPTFEIVDNPVVRGEQADAPLCHWHAAVFERLYRELVDDRYRSAETTCCACGAEACRFELYPAKKT